VQDTARLIEERYVDAGKARQIGDRLREAGPRWDAITDSKLFAEAITKWLREIAGDGHLGLSYSEKAVTCDMVAMGLARIAMRVHCGQEIRAARCKPLNRESRSPGSFIPHGDGMANDSVWQSSPHEPRFLETSARGFRSHIQLFRNASPS
jgi:hypothetical protein